MKPPVLQSLLSLFKRTDQIETECIDMMNRHVKHTIEYMRFSLDERDSARRAWGECTKALLGKRLSAHELSPKILHDTPPALLYFRMVRPNPAEKCDCCGKKLDNLLFFSQINDTYWALCTKACQDKIQEAMKGD